MYENSGRKKSKAKKANYLLVASCVSPNILLLRTICRGGQANFLFLKSAKSQIHKFMGSFHYRILANILDVLVRKSQIIRTFLLNTAQL
jgi:hypothetical protein